MNLIDRLLGRKQSRTTRIDTRHVMPQDAVWTPRDYKPLAEEGYQQAVWVYACIREITVALKQVTLLLYSNDREHEVDTHDLLDLMRRPNPFQSGDAWLESVIAYLLLSGNSYIEKVGPRAGPPQELWVKRPDRMKVLPDPTHLIRGYRYQIGEDKIDFLKDEIRHIKTFHPLNDYYGMSAIEAAARGVDAFNTGMSHNVALMQNGARPSGAWVTEQNLDDTQFNRFNQQIKDRARLENRGKELLLEAGVDWKEMGLSPRDLDWLQGLQDAGRQIHAAFGVHPVLTGLQEGTFENQQQAMRGLYLRTVLPLLDHVLAELNAWLLPTFGITGLELGYDRDAIPALSEDQDALFTRAITAFEKGILKRNEARVMLGFEEAEGGDVFSNDLAPQVDPNEDDPSEANKAFNLTTLEQKTARWTAFHEHQLRWEARYERSTTQAFREELVALRERLSHAMTPDDIADTLTLSITDEAWLEIITAHNLAIAESFGEEALRGLKTTHPAHQKAWGEAFGTLGDHLLSLIARHAMESVRSITATTRTLLKLTLTEGMSAGESIQQIAKRIDRLYLEQIIPNRSRVIARTETIRASNMGNQEAAKSTGLPIIREWVSTRDSRTRDAHARADGQRAPMGTPYDIGGELLMHPGDPTGSARNTIQCRCTEIYHVQEG